MISVSVGLLAIAVGTKVVGWVAIPAVGWVIGFTRPEKNPVLTAAAAGALGWGVLLAWGMSRGPVLDLADLLGGVFGGAPGAVILAVTLLFPLLLAGAAAGMGSAVRAMRSNDAG